MGKLQPLSDRLLVLPIEETGETETDAGLILPEGASDQRYYKGKVIAIGPGALDGKGDRVPPECKVGDIIYYGVNKGTAVKEDKVKYLVLREADVLVIRHE
jgi:chaperonin GroES